MSSYAARATPTDGQALAYLETSLKGAERYPENLAYTALSQESLKKYARRLRDDEERLFCSASNAELDMLEAWDSLSELKTTTVFNVNALKDALQRPFYEGAKDPLCRLIFVNARTSRDALEVTREMLCYVCSYHQVMPQFLDFLNPFGEQEYPRDFYFSAFRHTTRVHPIHPGLYLPALGRSGQILQLCYNLKAVEWRFDSWTIRQAAIFHSFDVQTGRTCWITVKGSKPRMRRIITPDVLESNKHLLDPYVTTAYAFAAALEVHIALCEWSNEHWRAYINSLERQFQEHSRIISVASFLQPETPPVQSRSTTFRRSSLKHLTPELMNGRSEKKVSWRSEKQNLDDFEDLEQTKPHGPLELTTTIQFEEVQRMHHTEETVNQALLVLKTNITIITALRAYYGQLQMQSYFDKESAPQLREEIIPRFEKRMAEILDDMHMHIAGLHALLQTIIDRRALLSAGLEYAKMGNNKESRENTEMLTHLLDAIGRQSARESVTTRTVALIALFFLPGIFTATLLSTDIVQYYPGQSGNTQSLFSGQALWIFFVIFIPLTAFGFFLWYFYHFQLRFRALRSAPVLELPTI